MYDESHCAALIERMSPELLRWAHCKTDTDADADDLVAEVWMEYLRTCRRLAVSGVPIADHERLVRRIAHRVWCHYVRTQAHTHTHLTAMPTVGGDDFSESRRFADIADPEDFAARFADAEEETARLTLLRRRIVMLGKLQREIMIAFYLDGYTIREIAARLSVTEERVKWHLYDTRKKLKEELTVKVETKTTGFVYRPRHLHVGGSGEMTVPVLDIAGINTSLSRQNICIACYDAPKTEKALSEMLGIPRAYLEDDVRWLCEKDFLFETPRGYATAFMIDTPSDTQDIYRVYLRHREAISDMIINGLSEKEAILRDIGFYGCDRPMGELLWWLIYRFCGSGAIPLYYPVDLPLRSDGGRYFPLGFIREDDMDEKTECVLPAWDYNGAMRNDGFSWFGMYRFGKSEIEDMMDALTPAWAQLHASLCDLCRAGGDVSVLDAHHAQGEKETILAQLVEKGFITLSPDRTHAEFAFCILTEAEEARLQNEVFAPIKEALGGALDALRADLTDLCLARVPGQLAHYKDLFVYMAMSDIGYVTTVLASLDGKLCMPDDMKRGAFLTMVYRIM